MTDDLVIIILTEQLDSLELFLEEEHKSRRRMRQALVVWGVIGVVSFLGIIAIVDRYLIIQ